MKKMLAGILGAVLIFSIAVPTRSAFPYTLEQTYRILQITAEDFISQLKGAGVSEQEISSFLNDLSEKISQQEALQEENFNTIMFSSMSELLQSGTYNNLYIAMISLYSEQFQTMLVTKEIPAEFQPLYQTVKACLLGTGELQVFEDVPKDHWARTSVEALAADGIVNGMGNRQFAPEDIVTREQFVKMAVDCLGLDEGEETAPFTDMTDGAWYVSYISAAYWNQLVSGVEEALFGVGQPMLRQDMAVIIHRILTMNEVVLSQDSNRYEQFEDKDQIDPYAQKAVEALCAGGLISGVSSSCFAPQELVTRAQAARMIDQMRLALLSNS